MPSGLASCPPSPLASIVISGSIGSSYGSLMPVKWGILPARASL